MNEINVIKRDGSFEPFLVDKIHNVLEWACEDIKGVSISEIELKANIQIFDGIKTGDIHNLLIRSASELISEKTPNYQYVAARLVNFKIRKEVYGDYKVPHLQEIIEKNIDAGVYDKHVINSYTKEQIDELNNYIDHSRDENFTYVGIEQFRSKYLIQNRSTGQIFESPQIAYMVIAMFMFCDEKSPSKAIELVKQFYDAVSLFYINLPTPIMGGLRTPTRQFSSCCVMESDDSLIGINSTASSIVSYVSKKAGIGINAGRIRAFGSKVGDGTITHTGIIPFLKHFNTAVKSVNQGGIRGGAATCYLPIWHLEFEKLVVLKNNKGTEETRLRTMDYCFQFNKLFYERLLSKGNITFFSPHDVPDLYDAFISGNNIQFKSLYEKYEKDDSIKKSSMPAIDVFSEVLTQRKDTGRIYIMNIDHANNQSSYVSEVAPISMSNLCTEITLPTKPLLKYEPLPYDKNYSNDDINNGLVSLCTLSAINFGLINNPKELEKYCYLIVRALDNLLDYQDYPIRAAYIATQEYRPLGIGIINLAYFLAKNKLDYGSEESLEVIDEYMEAFSYYLIKASNELAIERGPVKALSHTKYAAGIVPMDVRKQDVDELVAPVERLDWVSLRASLKQYGIRNSTLMAQMPAECQSLDNELIIGDNGEKTTLRELIIQNSDIKDIDNLNDIFSGQRFQFNKPVKLMNDGDDNVAYEFYYNGIQDVTEIEFIDGSKYKFTNNHKLRADNGLWVTVENINEEDIDGIKYITRNIAKEPTWDISTKNETYRLGNGCISHNTSAQISNATNGIEPPRAFLSYKQSKHGTLPQLVPGFHKLKNNYTLLWDMKSPEGYLKTVAIMQKYMDQAISANTSYNPRFYADGKLPMSQLIKDIVMAYMYGLKTLYYCNINDQAGEEETETCDSCTI